MNPDAETALANCSREPIHIAGAIQPHGALFVLDEPGLTVLQMSANGASFCGLDPETSLDRSLDQLAAEAAATVRAFLAEGDPTLLSPVRLTLSDRDFDAMLHRHDGVLFMELEPVSGQTAQSFHRRLQRAFTDLRGSGSLEALYEEMAIFIADLTGFERVMVYRFDEDWHGEVVGECLKAEVDSYLGHHFPASDIPAQARALYSRSWLRIIPDASYQPVPIVPPENPKTGGALDLSHSVLRSVSPVHLQYLRNMNVAASMSVSLMVEGRLWGLIACHHRAPKALSFAMRAACEMFGQVASLEITSQQEARRLAERMRATTIQTRFFDILAGERNVLEALVKYTPALLDFMEATGAAIHINEHTTLLGETPGPAETASIVAWLKTQTLEPLFATDSLQTLLPEAAAYREKASGLLAIKLSRVEPHYLLWFRPEVITTVTWAGNPDKPMDAQQVLHPRTSFVAWKQTVTGRSRPWEEAERHGASELVTALNALVLRRTESLIGLNAELERKNTDLNSFAYIAAHDLKEPLRGIANYCTFLREDHSAELSAEANRKIGTISALAVQSEELLNALSRFSQIGRIEIEPVETDLEVHLQMVLKSLESLILPSKARVIHEAKFPRIQCDPVLAREVFANLIANAIRYNNKDEKIVEIGFRPNGGEGGPVFFVRDNGIGIREKHFESIFVIFRRLHAHADYGGGTGAGLAIVKSIVEKHGGKIWLESQENVGTTFYFTLRPS